MASLDPLARREFLQVLMEAVAEHGISVLLSSHLVSDLERVCDHLVVLVDSRVRVDRRGRATCSATHHRLTGPRRDPATLPADQQVVVGQPHRPAVDARRPHRRRRSSTRPGRSARSSLEDLVLAYMRPGATPRPARAWRCSDDLADLAAVPRPGRRRRTRLVAAAASSLAVTGPRAGRLLDRHGRLRPAHHATTAGSSTAGIVVLALAPALIGVFWGAPLVARELEAGTHRLVWNQSVTRTRWLAVKLGPRPRSRPRPRSGVLTLAVTWWAAPAGRRDERPRTGSLPARLTPVSFAHARHRAGRRTRVFALVLGVAVGLVLRRSLPAMAVTLAVFAFVQIAVPLWVRPHLIPPVTADRGDLDRHDLDGIGLHGGADRRSTVPSTAKSGNRGDWVLSDRTVDAAGRAVAAAVLVRECLPPPPPAGPAGQAATEVKAAPGRLLHPAHRGGLPAAAGLPAGRAVLAAAVGGDGGCSWRCPGCWPGSPSGGCGGG